MKRAKRSIRSQIISGYRIVIAIMLVLVVISLLSLAFIYQDYQIVSNNQNNQTGTQAAYAKHYEWLELFNQSMQEGTEFSGSLDYNTCRLGQWLSSASKEDLADPVISQALKDIQSPHQQMHNMAGEILELSKHDQDAAYKRYINEIKPLVGRVTTGLDTISSRYQVIAQDAADDLQNRLLGILIVSVLCALGGLIASWLYGNRSAKSISYPISVVAEWAQSLSHGADHITVDPQLMEKNRNNEIGLMITSFQTMVDSIRGNINVIQRVAQGDMTVFVDIRSQEDVFGSNLYHMVQNNDLMVAQITEVAGNVARGSQHIADASHMLADAANLQTTAVSELTFSMDETRELATNNTQHVERALTLSNSIRQDVQISNEKMDHLVKAVGEIKDSSNRISGVIKLIENIAFQTNILALNAAVEAARAGSAGKGFAVVADEVRNLAARSAEAANESKSLIEATLQTTNYGSIITEEAFSTFQHIVTDLDQITNVIEEIAVASNRQTEAIDRIHTQVGVISDSVTANASASQQTAASSQEMMQHAHQLEEEIQRFKLRQRTKGNAYIPSEKVNDTEFIRAANKNYQHYHDTGTFSL